MRALLSALMVLLFAGSAMAGEEKEQEKGKDKQPVGQYVDVAPVAIPIIVDGQLINYVFVTLRLNLSSSVNMSQLRDKEPFFRDALVRTAFRQPFVLPTSYTQIDIKALKARMMAEAAKIAGAGAVTSVDVVGEPQPKRITGLPKPKGAPAPTRAPIP